MGPWSSGMILPLGGRGRGFDSRRAPSRFLYFSLYISILIKTIHKLRKINLLFLVIISLKHKAILIIFSFFIPLIIDLSVLLIYNINVILLKKFKINI